MAQSDVPSQTNVPSQKSRTHRPNLTGVQPDIAQFASVRRALATSQRYSEVHNPERAGSITRLPIPLRMNNYSVFEKSTAAQIGILQTRIIPEHSRERIIVISNTPFHIVWVSYGVVPSTPLDVEKSAISLADTSAGGFVFQDPPIGNLLRINGSPPEFASQNSGLGVSQDQICVSWISLAAGQQIDIKIFEGVRA
jgi:hypothetical protein